MSIRTASIKERWRRLFGLPDSLWTEMGAICCRAGLGVRTACWIAAGFALLTLLLLPFKPVGSDLVTVEIVASGERNALAKSSEVWLVGADALSGALAEARGKWQERDGMIGSFEGQPASISFAVDVESHPVIEFATHQYSGIAWLIVKGNRIREDLYSEVPGVKRVDLRQIAPSNIDYVKTSARFAGQFVGFFALWLVVILTVINTGSSSDENIRGASRLALLYTAPSLVIYAIVQLALWPGQMSPDSLDQWWQLSSGQLSDAQPILSTALYGLSRLIYGGPALAIMFQYSCLAFATGFCLVEMRQWGVGPRIAGGIAFLFPLFPANFLIGTTLWKDVPYTAALLLMVYCAARLIRTGFTMNRSEFVGMAVAGTFVTGLRHNGVLVSVMFFLLMAVVVPRGMKARMGILLVSQCVLFVLLKTLVLSAFHVSPMPPQYRAIVSAHIIGAMVAKNVPLSDSDQDLLRNIMPLSEWASSYRCDTVVPIFWNTKLERRELGKQTLAFNRLTLKLIAEHPFVYLRHQMCVTRLIWRISPTEGEWLSLSPLEITDVERFRSLGLTTHSKIEWLRNTLVALHERLGVSRWWTRPASYLLLAALIGILSSITVNRHYWLIVTPAFLNAGSLFPIIGAQDYRYLWPSIAVSIMTICFGIFAPKPKRSAQRSSQVSRSAHYCRPAARS